MRISRIVRTITLSLIVFGAGQAALHAQGDRGIINGRVTDASGARVPNAPIVLVDEDNKTTLKTISNGSGEYAFPSVVPGKYTIKVTATGFQNYKAEHIQVDVGTTKQIDASMQAGGTDTTVTVNAGQQLLDYDSADLGLVIEEKAVTDLPLIYGNAFALEYLAPGVSLSGVSPNVHVYDSGTSNVSVNGSQFNSIDYKLDGAADNRIRATAFTPNTESISQYRLATSTFDATQGHGAGGFVNVQVKSGTDRIHGSLFGYYQDASLNASSWQLTKGPVTTPEFKRGGFTIGGPIRRQKLFYFAGYEHSQQGNPNVGTAQVPTAAELAGDYSALYALDTNPAKGSICGTTPTVLTTPNAYQLFDPHSVVYNSVSKTYQRLCIPGNNVAKYGAGIDPVAAKYLSYYANLPGLVDNGAYATYSYALSDSDRYDGGIMRFDYSISPKQTSYLHLLRSKRFQQNAQVFAPVSGRTLIYQNYGAAIGHSYAVSPSFVVTETFGYTRFTNLSTNAAENTVTPTSIGLPSYLTDGLPKSANQLPRIDLTGYTSLNQNTDTNNTDDIWLGNVVASKQTGPHFLRFGGEYRRYITTGVSGTNENGRYSVTGRETTASDKTTATATSAGFSLAELQMNVLTGGNQIQNSDFLSRSHYFTFFLQDDWRASKRLTLNIGLRWEHETPLEELNSKEIVAFDFNAVNSSTAPAAAAYASKTAGTSPMLPATINSNGGAVFANTKGYGRAGYAAPKFDFSPRIGFAFAVRPKTVIRGGYGIFFDNILTNYLSGGNSGSTTTYIVPQQGYSVTTSIAAPAYSGGSATTPGTATLNSFANPFPGGLSPITGSSSGVNTALGQDLQFYQPNPHLPYAQRWSLGLQQQIGAFALQVNYVGNHSVHLFVGQTAGGANFGGRDYNATPSQYLSTYSGGADQAANAILGLGVINPFAGILPAGAGNGLNGPTVTVAQLLRPRPEFGRINSFTTDGMSIYHSVQVQVQRRFTSGFSTTQAFTFSKSLDATQFLNPSDAKPWFGISSADRPLRYSGSLIYQLPWGRGRHWLAASHGVVAQVIGGWQVQGVYQIQSGAPLTFGNVVYNGTGSPGDSHWSRSQYKGTQSQNSGKGGYWFNPDDWLRVDISTPTLPIPTPKNALKTCATYSSATPTLNAVCPTAQPGAFQIRKFAPRYGNLRADHLNQADIGVQRQFQVRELGTLQFRAEAVNVLNHPVYSAPNTDPTNALFDFIAGVANQPRVFQFAGFFRF